MQVPRLHCTKKPHTESMLERISDIILSKNVILELMLQKVDKSIRRVCKTPLTSMYMYFHVCEKNYPASPS